MNKNNPVDYDAVIIGSGPAGVSAAFPLLDAGLNVLLVDGGYTSEIKPPIGQYLSIRRQDPHQSNWMVGHDFHALSQADAVSPKLRTPTHTAIFKNFSDVNRISAADFWFVGSLASGGLSNAWGCGVACLTDEELTAFPIDPHEMRASYETISTRIGVSGGRSDDLSDYFGLDDWSQEPLPMDALQSSMMARYPNQRKKLHRQGFRLGRARVAALSEPKGDRLSCDLSGNCLWGCSRRALYSATEDLKTLRNHPSFHYLPGFLVDHVSACESSAIVQGSRENQYRTIRAKRVLLAAGTLASTRLALQAIEHRSPVSMQSCPTAAFLLWLPRHLGRSHTATFGLGQLSFSLGLGSTAQGFGSLFNTTGIPVNEYLRSLPFGKRYGIDLLNSLLSSCVIGNFFLPGSLTSIQLHLDQNNDLVIQGGNLDTVASLMNEASGLLRSAFWKLGALLVPTSFRVGLPGSDIHYAASLPMSIHPQSGQTDCYGELFGGNCIHIVDGAVLSDLPAKSHTLTIMANADRIAKHVARLISQAP